jgi:hypothetical protein
MPHHPADAMLDVPRGDLATNFEAEYLLIPVIFLGTTNRADESMT